MKAPKLIRLVSITLIFAGALLFGSLPAGVTAQGDIIIVTTTSSIQEQQVTATDIYYDDFLRKPFKKEDVFALMKQHLGLQYVYKKTAEIQTKASNSQTLQSHLKTLSQDLNDRLKEAAIQADMAEINTLIAEVRLDNTTLADSLQVWADNYEYAKIIALCEE